MTETQVLNLRTGNYQIYSLPPKEAVVAAYAQSLGDWNTWQYAETYEPREFTINSRSYVTLGDMTARVAKED